MSSLREQLLMDGNYFKRLLSLIPANYCANDAANKNAPETDSSQTTGGEMLLRLDRCDNLRDSLRQKIEELKSKRRKQGAPVDHVEMKRLKRKLSKAKLRERRRTAKQKTKELTPVGNKSVKSDTSPKQVFNKEGKLVYSKFDFSASGSKKRTKSGDVPTGKNYKALLQQAKKKENKISEVEMVDEDQAQEMSQKEIWKSALLKAEGIKVKDNPVLLKKAMKRHEQKKKISQRHWEERTKTLAKQMKDRQDKRARNIAKKKEGRASKKIQRAKKRGRVVVN